MLSFCLPPVSGCNSIVKAEEVKWLLWRLLLLQFRVDGSVRLRNICLVSAGIGRIVRLSTMRLVYRVKAGYSHTINAISGRRGSLDSNLVSLVNEQLRWLYALVHSAAISAYKLEAYHSLERIRHENIRWRQESGVLTTLHTFLASDCGSQGLGFHAVEPLQWILFSDRRATAASLYIMHPVCACILDGRSGHNILEGKAIAEASSSSWCV